MKVKITQGTYTMGHHEVLVKDASGKESGSGHYESKRIPTGAVVDLDDAEAKRLLSLGVAEYAKG